jgi:hypothetical protein
VKRKSRLGAAALAAAALLACAPAAAHAAVSASVTDDAGNFATLTPGAPLAIHNLSAQALVHVDKDATNGLFSAAVTDQNGATDGLGADCYLAGDDAKLYPDYHGDMGYTLTVTTYAPNDFSCARPKATYTYAWTVGAVVAIAPPAGPLLERDATGALVTQALGFSGAPGATTYQVKYALNGVVQPDGSLGGAVQDGYIDSTTGKLQLLATKPGTYVVVARAGSAAAFTPWSAPVTLHVLAPFAFIDSFPDAIGPRYTIRGKLDEGSARGGKVTLAAAKGRHGKRFRTLGHGTIDKHGVFKIHITLHRRGVYLFRYTFKGRGTVAGGRVLEAVKISRILS